MTPANVFITGAGGMLATALEAVLKPVSHVTALTEAQLDITDKQAVLRAVQGIKPGVIVNAAAYTAVDRCETDTEKAMLVNGTAVGYLAQAAQVTGARIIHISTDYLFDGRKDGPYTEKDEPNPLSVYGRSKLFGEQELARFTDRYVIVRTQWMYGENGKNFVDTILQLAQQKDELRVVDDQYGSPTYTKDLAAVIRWFVEHSKADGQTFHFSDIFVLSYPAPIL